MRAALDCQLTACRGLPAPPQVAESSRLSSRGRRARRFSSGFHHCGPNRAHPLDVCTSRSGGARRTPLLNWCFSFHGPGSFSNSRIRHRSALDIRLARFRRLRTRSVYSIPLQRVPRLSRISSSVSLAGADFFSRDLDLRGAGVGDSEVSLFRRLRCLRGKLGFFFAGNDHFLRMYFPDENDAADYYPEKSFQHDAA